MSFRQLLALLRGEDALVAEVRALKEETKLMTAAFDRLSADFGTLSGILTNEVIPALKAVPAGTSDVDLSALADKVEAATAALTSSLPAVSATPAAPTTGT